MSSDLAPVDRLTAELVEGLTAVLPTDWKLIDAESQAATALQVVLFYEQGDLVTTLNGKPVPTGYVGVEYTLTLVAPEAEPQKGTARVSAAMLDLLPALDALDDLYWDRAGKMRLTTGETAYRLEVVHLSQYTTRPTPDPTPNTTPEEA